MDEDRYRDAERRLWASVGASPVEQHITLPRIGTRVRIQVVGEGPPVVFVHGAMTNGTAFASLAAHLTGFRCVLLDRPGCGLSDALSGTLALEHLPRFAEELVVDLLDALDLERAHLVGTSFGGYVTLRAAAAQPDRVDRLVLLGWTVGAPITRLPAIMRLASIPGLGLLMAAIPPNERAVRSMLRQVGPSVRGRTAARRTRDPPGSWSRPVARPARARGEQDRRFPGRLTAIRSVRTQTMSRSFLRSTFSTGVRGTWSTMRTSRGYL